MQKLVYLTEFFLIFIFFPLLFLSNTLKNEMIMPMLWLVFLYTLFILHRNGQPFFGRMFRKNELILVLKRYLLISPALLLIALVFFPHHLFDFPRKEPVLWSILIFAYPIVSALVQEVIFRRFFFWRYRPLFKKNSITVLINAVLFSYTHAVFLNPLAVILTFIGSLIFAFTFIRSRSLLLVTIEHTLYGNTLFTIGLGSFFYHQPFGEGPFFSM